MSPAIECTLGRGLLIISPTKDLFKFWNLLQLSFFKQLNKKSQLTFLQQIVALLFLQVQYINYNLSEIIIVHVVKAAIIVISEHFNLSTLLVVSHVLSIKMSPAMKEKPEIQTMSLSPE